VTCLCCNRNRLAILCLLWYTYIVTVLYIYQHFTECAAVDVCHWYFYCRVDTGIDKILARTVAEDHWTLQGKRCTGWISDCGTCVSHWCGCGDAPVELRSVACSAHVWWRSDRQTWVPQLADWVAGENEGCWWHGAEADHGSSSTSESFCALFVALFSYDDH